MWEDCGKSQNEHTCTTKPFSDTNTKQGTEEDVGAKFDIPTAPPKKTIPWRSSILPPDFLFRLEKPLKQKLDNLRTLGDKGNNTEAPQINSFIYHQWSRARLVGSQGQTCRELSPGPELHWAFQPPRARRFSFTAHLLSGSVPSLSSSSFPAPAGSWFQLINTMNTSCEATKLTSSRWRPKQTGITGIHEHDSSGMLTLLCATVCSHVRHKTFKKYQKYVLLLTPSQEK